MKYWTVKVFDKNDNQIPFEKDGSFIMQETIKSNSKFLVKKFAKALTLRTPSAESYSIVSEG